jgi:hypothetical protein
MLLRVVPARIGEIARSRQTLGRNGLAVPGQTRAPTARTRRWLAKSRVTTQQGDQPIGCRSQPAFAAIGRELMFRCPLLAKAVPC